MTNKRAVEVVRGRHHPSVNGFMATHLTREDRERIRQEVHEIVVAQSSPSTKWKSC